MSNKILIVDDDEMIRSELYDSLDRYNVIEAASGEEALKLLADTNDIRLVILDVTMPGRSGLDVLTQIRRTNADVGIIIFTGNGSRDTAIEALKAKADDYIEKPFQVSSMRDAVERLLKGRLAQGPEAEGRDKVKKAKYFVEKNCYKKTRLNDAARAVCCSPKYLSRIFKQQTGMAFSTYRLNIQMANAKKILVKAGSKVDQVAEKLGYENVESFSRQFKSITGLTPTAYRAQKQQRAGKRRKT